MRAPFIVPRGLSEWKQEPLLQFRVEYQREGERRTIYFDDLAAAVSIAASNTCFGAPCVVEVRDMPITHRVEHYASANEAYALSSDRFGDLKSARLAYNERIEILQSGHGVRLIHQATGVKLADWWAK